MKNQINAFYFKVLPILFCLFFAQSSIFCQSNDSITMDTTYYQIPDYPDSFAPTMIIARMIDGLGFRYYWVTEGLRDVDLAYEPGNGGQSCRSTLEHIAGLTNMVLIAVKGETQSRGQGYSEYTYKALRNFTLKNIKEASVLLKSENTNVEDVKIVFERGDKISSFPVWNLLNGPLADAIYHTGQVVSYRRSSGNPIPTGVSVFRGEKK